MLGFDPTPEQEALREMTRKFAANEIRPRAAEWDRVTVRGPSRTIRLGAAFPDSTELTITAQPVTN